MEVIKNIEGFYVVSAITYSIYITFHKCSSFEIKIHVLWIILGNYLWTGGTTEGITGVTTGVINYADKPIYQFYAFLLPAAKVRMEFFIVKLVLRHPGYFNRADAVAP